MEEIVPELFSVPIVPPTFFKPYFPAVALIFPVFVSVVIVADLLYKPFLIDWIFPELVRVVIVAPSLFHKPYSFVDDIVPELVNVLIEAPVLFDSPFSSDAEIVPLLVKVVLVAFATPTASLVPSIVTPELIVTLDPSPSISRSVQLVEKVAVEPEMSLQSADCTRELNRKFSEKKIMK